MKITIVMGMTKPSSPQEHDHDVRVREVYIRLLI